MKSAIICGNAFVIATKESIAEVIVAEALPATFESPSTKLSVAKFKLSAIAGPAMLATLEKTSAPAEKTCDAAENASEA
ncbi:hypothetical protein CMK18_22585, partial [Candidatus Poribacteria bacterium]|nr:hypothetical protein [Candidatus Poribacteria bacterium]